VSAPNTRNLPLLDALRGVAILGVILVHANDGWRTLSWPMKALSSQGGWGVELFFILSAVTLLMSWHGRHDRAPNDAFLVRRFFRIAPMF
jgi:peptidoglycan/LPS O-acetylase OafA/YrhL